ncbi:MAG: multidrug DMT transporter permease [Clostridia bacterium]|nr:MAG: multidrug DMT transporter permease [Clostridia bacterium]
MTLTAVFFITISVFAHVGWNLISKSRQPSGTFFLIANTAALLLVIPLLGYYRSVFVWVPSAVWALVAATGFFQTIYYLSLAGAYRRGDMSLAYPMLRALPVLFITAVSFILGRGHQIRPFGLLGILMVAFGCLLLPLKSFRHLHFRDYLALCCLLALVAAVGTTGYTLVDDEALRQLRTHFHPWMGYNSVTLFYVVLQTLSIEIWLGLYVLLFRAERNQSLYVWRKDRVHAAVAGIVLTFAYGLVLASMAYVVNISYVAAFRQLSIPLGAAAGMLLLNEPRYFPKLIGVGVIMGGLMLVALV